MSRYNHVPDADPQLSAASRHLIAVAVHCGGAWFTQDV
jgi:hypothetical protein